MELLGWYLIGVATGLGAGTLLWRRHVNQWRAEVQRRIFGRDVGRS